MENSENLNVAFGECLFGKILVAESSKGLRCLFLGECTDNLLRDIEKQFPSANIKHTSEVLGNKIDLIQKYIDKPIKSLNFPLDIRGTSFQIRVWKELKSIPIGTTTTYKDIAHRINNPNASRAVARACAQNLLAIVIPCHRIIASNGELTGYRWGINRKQILLEREKKALKSSVHYL